jgi:predicted amidohydrolase
MSEASAEIGVACVQFAPERGGVEGNLTRSVEWIHRAADAGHELVVLPELSNSGYAFANRAESWESAEVLPDGHSCRAWRAAARERRVWIVGGLAERSDRSLYDTAVLIDRDGAVLSRYRKMHLWSREHLWFEPGRVPSEITKLPFGRLAIAICFDLWIPELFRYYALAGADIVCMPSNWSSPATVQGAERPIVDYLAMGTAHVNAMFLVGADRSGSDGDVDFLGASMIVNPRGEIIARAALPAREEELTSAKVDIMDARIRKTWSRFNRASDVSADLVTYLPQKFEAQSSNAGGASGEAVSPSAERAAEDT